MKVTEYCDILNLQIRLTYYPNQNGRWCATFENCEIKEHESSGMLSEHGNGKTPADAIANYVSLIRGKRLVVSAMSEERREYNIPAGLKA